MAKVVMKGTPFDGEYELDEGFTMGELHTIKKATGLRGGELNEALRAGDTDVVLAMALVALGRANVPVDQDQLWNCQAGTIRLDLSDGEDEEPAEDPPLAAASK